MRKSDWRCCSPWARTPSSACPEITRCQPPSRPSTSLPR